MRIGVSASSLGSGGGMERYALDVIGGLAAVGNEPAIFCRKADRDIPEIGRMRDVHVLNVGWAPGKFRDWCFSRRLDRARRNVRLDAHIACCMVEHPDIAVCGGTHIGYLRAMRRNPGLFDRVKIALERRQYANARRVIAHSRMMRDELLELYGVPGEKINLLYPPVDGGRFGPAAPEERAGLRREFGFSEGRRVFLFPSGGHVRKGLPFLREFFEKTDLPVDLVAVGRAAAGGRNIRSLGYVRNIERLYQAADATILASAYEPFGLVGVESILCGTPVVFPADMGCCEVIAEAARATFVPGDRGSLEAAVRRMLDFDREMLKEPLSLLGYDCRISRHVEAILKVV